MSFSTGPVANSRRVCQSLRELNGTGGQRAPDPALENSTERSERAPDDGTVGPRRPKLDFNGLTVGIYDRSISWRWLHLAARSGELQPREERFDFHEPGVASARRAR